MHRYLRFLLATATVVASATATSSVYAQGVTTSAVTGTVEAEGLGPIQGAVVRLRNPATGDRYEAVTDDSGAFFIDNVQPGGPYTLTASAEAYKGYKGETRNNVYAQLGQRTTVNLNLGLQLEEAEQITIIQRVDPLEDQARSGPTTTVNERSIGQLPLQGRNFTDLIVTAPQVSGTSVAGQNNRFNNIQVDGGVNNDVFGLAASGTPGGQANAKPISIEAVREFQIQVAPFDVRQSSFTGGLINAVTKSGSNDFRGSLFMYLQNKSLVGDRDEDPNDPKTIQDNLQDYSTWQLGGTLSGPIIEDKLHFFVSADLQERQESFGSQVQLTGNDSIDRANTGFTFAEVAQFQSILAMYGINNAGGGEAPKLDNPDRNLFVKLSSSLIPSSRAELTYNLVDASQDTLLRAVSATAPTLTNLRDGYQLSNSGYAQVNTTNTVRFKLTSNFLEGKLSNEFLAGFSSIRDHRDLAQRLPLILVQAGKRGATNAYLAAGGERFSHENILDQDIFQVQDNVTFGLGPHRITAGTSNEFFDFRNVFFQAAFGAYIFNDTAADPDENGFNEFMAGTPSAYQRRFGVSDLQEPGTAEFNVAQLGFYLQDEWSIFKNLTVTGGVRVDIPFLSDANSNPTVAMSPLGIDTSDVPSGNPLWSPRLGFNWNVDGEADTVVRGGTGIFTGRPPYVWVSNAYSINGLSQVQLSCSGATVPRFTADPDAQPSDCMGGTTPPTAPTNAGEIDYFDPDTKYPQNWRIGLGVDQRLPFGLVGTVDLLYTQDVNGWYTTDANLTAQPDPSGEGRTLYGTLNPMTNRLVPMRPDTTNLTNAVKVYNKNGGKVYNATVQISRPFFTDYDFSVAYTFSRSEDLMSFTSSQGFSNLQFAPLDGSLEDRNARPSAFDRTHKITVSGSARLPFGFNAGLIYIGQSGTPYTFIVNGDANGDGISNDLVYVPRSPDEISLSNAALWDAGPPTANGSATPGLNDFIESQDCLKEARGRFIKRGECRNPFSHVVNLRLGWGHDTVANQRLEVQFDIFNVMNLLNSDWGVVDRAAAFETGPSFLQLTGWDAANNRPVYTYAPPVDANGKLLVETPSFTATQSRWRIQLGARYLF